MYLLNKQTEIEQESKKSERVFDEKVKLYQKILDIVRDMMMDGKISKEEINKLPFPLIRLGMLGKDETIESFNDFYNYINDTFQFHNFAATGNLEKSILNKVQLIP